MIIMIIKFMKMMIRFEHRLIILQENENNHVDLDFTTSYISEIFIFHKSH